MRILHIGSFTSQHTLMAGIAYEKLGYDVIFFNTQKKANLNCVSGLPDNFKFINPYTNYRQKRFESFLNQIYLIARYLGKHDHIVFKELELISRKYEIDCIISTWGFTVLEIMLVCQKVFPNVRSLHNILTIPDLPIESTGFKGLLWQQFDSIFNFIQNRAYKKMISNCSIRVYATDSMYNYVKSKFGPFNYGVDILRLELFNKCFFPVIRKEKLSKLTGQPHIVHIGATNFTKGMEIDDVSNFLIKISNSKINIHLNATGFPPQLSDANENFIHYFKKFSSDFEKNAFAEFLTQFDAIIILYNVKKVYKRFEFSLPTRFLFALIVGIPVVLPKDLFPACEKYIIDHEIGFSYTDEQDLYNKLLNDDLMKKLSAKSLKHSQTLDFESNSKFFSNMLNN